MKKSILIIISFLCINSFGQTNTLDEILIDMAIPIVRSIIDYNVNNNGWKFVSSQDIGAFGMQGESYSTGDKYNNCAYSIYFRNDTLFGIEWGWNGTTSSDFVSYEWFCNTVYDLNDPKAVFDTIVYMPDYMKSYHRLIASEKIGLWSIFARDKDFKYVNIVTLLNPDFTLGYDPLIEEAKLKLINKLR